MQRVKRHTNAKENKILYLEVKNYSKLYINVSSITQSIWFLGKELSCRIAFCRANFNWKPNVGHMTPLNLFSINKTYKSVHHYISRMLLKIALD